MESKTYFKVYSPGKYGSAEMFSEGNITCLFPSSPGETTSMCMAKSLCRSRETVTTLLISYVLCCA